MLSSINNKQNCQCVLTKDVRFLYYKKEVHSFKSNQSIWFDLKFIAYSFCTLDGSKGRDVVTTDGGFNTYNDKLLLIIMLQTILHNLDLNCHKSKKKKKKKPAPFLLVYRSFNVTRTFTENSQFILWIRHIRGLTRAFLAHLDDI